jgi:hypothetical protein
MRVGCEPRRMLISVATGPTPNQLSGDAPGAHTNDAANFVCLPNPRFGLENSSDYIPLSRALDRVALEILFRTTSGKRGYRRIAPHTTLRFLSTHPFR